jgi:23S rRNA pseudouridine2605 synthase
LQKVLAQAGVASRRHAEELISAGRVRVGGQVVTTLGVRVDPGRDTIEVDGRRVTAEPLTYVLFHKPRGVVSTMHDPAGRPAVADYVKDVGARVVPVGRLDFQTSGVMLLTNDGAFARDLLHPSRGVLKEYVLKIKGRIDDAGLARLRESIDIDGRPTRPARVEIARHEGDKTWLEVVLHEGKNRQIRRLAEHAGYRVMRLARCRFAGLTLEGLRAGEWRQLTRAELRALRAELGTLGAER